MYLDCDPPIAGGRELWGFPKKLASPILKVENDTLGGALRFGPVPVAVATMGYKHRRAGQRQGARVGGGAGLPAQDHPARRRHAAHLRDRALPLRGRHRPRRVDRAGGAGAVPPRTRTGGDLPVLEVLSATHILSDLTLDLGTVVHDYLAK